MLLSQLGTPFPQRLPQHVLGVHQGALLPQHLRQAVGTNQGIRVVRLQAPQELPEEPLGLAPLAALRQLRQLRGPLCHASDGTDADAGDGYGVLAECVRDHQQ